MAIYAIHLIMYQTPIFKALNDYISDHGLSLEVDAYFGDDLSLKEVFSKRRRRLSSRTRHFFSMATPTSF